jgi:phosphoenolpyruvate---glycerone phosphotransferase subunit DhaL
MSIVDAAGARAWVEHFGEAFDDSYEELTELDRQAGDGDFGANVQGALRRAVARLQAGEALTVTDVFEVTALSFMGGGGTSGPLFGVWFRAFAREAQSDGVLSVTSLAAAAAAGTKAVQTLGRAEVGDKTMVDAMAPAAAALADAAAHEIDAAHLALEWAAEAARAGAEDTRPLRARRGRATYVGKSAVGVVDPGALTVAIFLMAGAEALGNAPGSPTL